MRIPFIGKVDRPADLGVEDARLRSIRDSRGGSSGVRRPRRDRHHHRADGAADHVPGPRDDAGDVAREAANVKVLPGPALLFTDLWHDSYPPQLAASGAVSLLAALLVWRDGGRTLSLYLR